MFWVQKPSDSEWIDQVYVSGNIYDLYLGVAKLKSQLGHRLTSVCPENAGIVP